jgi:CheY-like chemotaxis protein
MRMSLPFVNHKFLLIDDSDIDSVITSKILQLSGLPKENITVRHAMPALALLEAPEAYFSSSSITEESPLIILLDIHMPEMNGFAFLDEFDQMDSSVADCCKIFLLTSSIDPSDIERANENAYVVRVLNKPLNVEELLLYFD